MSALLKDLELTGVDPDAVEASMASGGLVPEGIHHAALSGCREVQANSGSEGRELTFKVLAGPGAGLEVKETLWISADPKAKSRRILFMHKLGLLRKVAAGDRNQYVPVEGRHDFTDCLGAECLIDVRHVEDTWTDKKSGKERKANKAELTFGGVMGLDDPRGKDVPRGKPGAGKAAAAAAPAGQKDDFGDL